MSGDNLAISFGPALQDEVHGPLRARIAALAQGRSSLPVHVDTVLGFDPACSGETRGPQKLLLFDFHRLFLFDDSKAPGNPSSGSLVRFILDDYPARPIAPVRSACAGQPFPFLYSLDALEILAGAWALTVPGQVLVFELSAGEITTSFVGSHPEAVDPLVTPAEQLSAPPPATMELGHRPAGPGFRSGVTCDLEGLTSSNTGVIRGERLTSSYASLPNGTARVAWRDGAEESLCGGVSLRARDALFVARCEALERFFVALQLPGDPLVFGSYSELGGAAVDPESIFFRSPRLQPGGNHTPYDASVKMHWTWADNPLDGTRRLVPAQEIWFNTDRLPGEHLCIRNTTNGCALGATLEEAALFALCEAIERDAYLVMWYLRRRCEKIAPESVPYEQFQLLMLRFRRVCPNYRLHFFDAGTDIAIPAVVVVAARIRGRGAKTLHAAAARPRVELALFAALKEICGRIAPVAAHEFQAAAGQFIREPEKIFTPDDHKALYALDETFDRLSFLGFEGPPNLDAAEIDRRSLIPRADSYDLGAVISSLTEHLAAKGIPVLLKDITHPDFRARNIHCVKVIAPGLFPMWYGHRYLRFSLTERLKRLAQQHTRTALTHESELNLDVHPFG